MIYDYKTGDEIGRSVTDTTPAIGEHFTFKKNAYRVVYVNHGDLSAYRVELYVAHELKVPFHKNTVKIGQAQTE
jgi:hypothetical protein